MKTRWTQNFLVIGLVAGLLSCAPSHDLDGTAAPDAAPHLDAHDICLVTQYTENLRPFADLAVANQKAYAQKQGYRYQNYLGRISGNLFQDPSQKTPLRKGGLYWQKITAVKNHLNDTCKWVMWLDADVVITNPNRKVEQIISTFAYRHVNGELVEKNVLMPRDEANPAVVINNGVFLVKNNDWSKKFMDQVEGLYPIYKNLGTPEQDAFRDVIFQVVKPSENENAANRLEDYQKSKILPEVGVIPQRVMDSFYRPESKDTSTAHWKRCDFIAHISGTPDDKRTVVLERLQEELNRYSCD